MDNHPEIKTRKTVQDFFEDGALENLLLTKIILFKEDSDLFEYSGLVTAALFDFEPDEHGQMRTVLGIKTPNGWFTFKNDRDSLKSMLEKVEAVIGTTPEQSFLVS